MDAPRRLRFGDFEIDVHRGRLRRHGRPVKIQPQPLRVLTTLAERAGEIVSREELRRTIWDSATFVEFDQGLNFSIRQIRLALEDDAAKPIYLETVKGQGYRFIATVTAAVSFGVDPIEAASPPQTGADVEAMAAGPRTSHWPVILDRLIGREHDLSQVLELLQLGRLVTLTGTGGVGKTRLAIECARRFAAAGGAVQWIDLTEATRAPDVVPTIARALGLADTVPGALMARLREMLAERDGLFVFDNFEHVLEAAPALLDLRAPAARAAFLVTSRVRLNLRGEREFLVSPLRSHRDDAERRAGRLSPAVELYADRMGDAATDGASIGDDAERLCARLDGLPLAIELAAARARVLPTADLVRRERLIALLTAAPRDVPDRHQTLTRTLQWSYGLLSADAQRSLSTLAVFVGGFTAAAGAAVLVDSGVAASDVMALDLIGMLRDHSLIARAASTSAGERWHLLETVREFALDHRSAADGANAERARARWMATLMEQEAPALRTNADVIAMPALVEEHPNLVAALRFAADSSNADLLIRLVNAATWFWHTANLFLEGREWNAIARRMVPRDADVDSTALRRLLAADALMAYHLGPFDDAMRAAEGVIVDGGADFEGTLAICLRAALLAFAGNLETAAAASVVARDSAAALGDRWLQGLAALASAQTSALAGDAAQAERYLADAPGALGFLSVLIDFNRRLQQIEQGEIATAAAGFAPYLRQRYGGYHPLRQIAGATEGLAYVCAHAGEWETCARLLARADRWRAETAPLHPAWRRQHDRSIEAARDALGARFTSVWNEGASLALDEAIGLAAQAAEAARAIPRCGTPSADRRR